LISLSGCAIPALPAAASLIGTGAGVTVYKKATENSPLKAEFVLIKVEANHIVYQNTRP
jgi:hypothetical protein